MLQNKLFLIFHGRFPSERAASLFAAKSAESFSLNGLETVLVVPRRIGRDKKDVYEYYGVKNNFNIVYLPVLDFYFIPFFKQLSFIISFFSFSISVFLYLCFFVKKSDIVFSNESLPLFFVSFISKNTLYEMHDFPESKHFLFKFFITRVRWILSHNKWKAEKLCQLFGIDKDKILIELNAVDTSDFKEMDKVEARNSLELPLDKKIVMYTGHLYSWKGADVLASAALDFGMDDVIFIFVGGTFDDVLSYKKRFNKKNILFVGNKKHKEIPLWQSAADVLVLPNTAKEDISKYYTSPMKLFEYMATNRPIVASDLPSIREIVTSSMVIFFEPDNVSSLKEKLSLALNQEFKQSQLIKEKIAFHTWVNRAQRIIEFIKKN